MESLNPEDFSVKKIISEEKFIDSTQFDPEETFYYVHVLKGKGLGFARTRYSNPVVELKIGRVRKTTDSCRDISHPEWNRVFAFSEDDLCGSSILRVSVKQAGTHGTRLLGRRSIVFDVDSPEIVPSNCTPAPEWIRLHNREENDWVELELLLAIFSGYQGDRQWNLDARYKGTDALPDIRSLLYFTPKLWYLRVNVIQASDLLPASNLCRDPQFFVKVGLGNQTWTTRKSRGTNPMWNQDLMFVASRQFWDNLRISVENFIPSARAIVVGRCAVSLEYIAKRSDDKAVDVICLNLETDNPQLVSRIYLRVCLEEGYHVQYESLNYRSDVTPTDTKLCKPKIGVLELGILRVTGLIPMKTRDGQQTTDAYCVAKYGDKWVRTTTIDGSVNPVWNEVFRWDVFDPYTFVTVGVFDSCHAHDAGAKDARVGKVRIRLSTLWTGRVYTHSYPLLVIQPDGVKKMGEIDLAVKFTCSSWLKLMHTYSQPLLPKMHYIRPLANVNFESLRLRAAEIVSMHLVQREPPLKKDVVDYILNLDSDCWSIRRSFVNYSRIVDTLVWLCILINDIFTWRSTPKTLFAAFCIFMFIFLSEMILPFLPLLVFFIGLLSYFRSSDLPPHIDATLSQATTTGELDLDEELDTYPSSRDPGVVSKRYDRLRRSAGIVQTTLGQVSGMMERLFLLLSWRDRRATALFLVFNLITCLVLVPLWFASRYMYSRYMYHVPLSQVLQVLVALYLFRPPKFRRLELLSCVFNFFWRLPTRHDNFF